MSTAADCRGDQSCLIGFYVSLNGVRQQNALASEDALNSCATKEYYLQTMSGQGYYAVGNVIVTNVAVVVQNAELQALKQQPKKSQVTASSFAGGSCVGKGCIFHPTPGQIDKTLRSIFDWVHSNSEALGWVEVGLGVVSMLTFLNPVVVAGALVVGALLTVATTVDACENSDAGGCAVGSVSSAFTAVGFGFGRAAGSLAEAAKEAGFFGSIIPRIGSIIYGANSFMANNMSLISGGISAICGSWPCQYRSQD